MGVARCGNGGAAAISRFSVSTLAVVACATLACAGTNAGPTAWPAPFAPEDGLMAPQMADRASSPPILEELCARLAAFGLTEPMGMAPRSARVRECKPLLLRFGPPAAHEPTSIFTTARAEPGTFPETLSVRFKINALDPGTQAQAIALVERAVRSILRGHDVEMPDAFAEALQKLESGSHRVGPVLMEIATERDDPRRHNVFLSLQGMGRAKIEFMRRQPMFGSSTHTAGQVTGGI